MRLLRTLLVPALVVLVFASCSDDPIGIFESIERERPIEDDRDLRNDINVASIDRSGNRYYIAAGTLYYRDAADEITVNAGAVTITPAQWAVAYAPNDGAPYTTSSLVATNLTGAEGVYSVYANRDADDFQLVRLAASPAEEGSTVLATGDAGTGDDIIAKLGGVWALDENDDGTDDYLVVSAQIAGSVEYALFASSDGTTFTEINQTQRFNDPYVDVIATDTDGSNGNIYVSTQAVLHDPDGIGTPDGIVPLSPGKTGTNYVAALYEATGQSVWLADDSGYLYSSSTAPITTWVKSGQTLVSGSSEDTLAFTALGLVPVPGGAPAILVGTAGNGYRIVGEAGAVTAETATVSSPDEDGSNYEASDLARTVVNTFFADDELLSDYPIPGPDAGTYQLQDGYLFFAGTSNQGLWRALSYDDPDSPTDPVQWVRE